MNIELARTFLEVVSTSNMARAAETLNVTHSTVTMRIKLLEEILRKQVLIRRKTGVTMTADGARFYPFAETLVRTWQMTRRQMSLASGYENILSVGADQTLWDDLMFHWVCDHRRREPSIAVRCESGTSETLTNRLYQGWLDFCLVYEARTTSGFTVDALFDDPVVLASTEDRGMKYSFDPDFVDIEWDQGVRAQEEFHWGENTNTPHIGTMSAQLSTRFVLEFGGSVIVPLRALSSGAYAGKLYPIKGSPVMHRKVYMVYSEEAIKQRLPYTTIAQIKQSILDKLEIIDPTAQ